jgi:hypothetical protein
LSTIVFALIESQRRGWIDLLVTASTVVGVVGLLAFVAWERRVPHRDRHDAHPHLRHVLHHGGLLAAGINSGSIA